MSAPPDNLGVTFASLQALGLDAALTTATWAEDLGYQSYWTAETTGPEAFSTLAAVGAVAPSLDLGTGVLALQLRTPPLTAMAAATLQALRPDRDIVLGIGISSPVVTSQWHGAPYGDRPLAHVREFVEYYLKEGGALAREVQYVPLPDSAYKTALRHVQNGRKGTVFGGVAEVGITVEELLRRDAKL